jgi:glycosyltransferase EpsH
MTPKVSVVLPVYNAAKYLGECLDSLREQSLQDIEIILVDDGSLDDSWKIIDAYQRRDSRFVAFHQVNSGVSAARNAALKWCSGKYIFFADSDDYLERNALEVMYNDADRSQADVVIGDHCSFRDSVEKKSKFFQKSFVTEDTVIIAGIQRMVLYKGYSPYISAESSYMFSALWTKLIKRDLIEKNEIRFVSSLDLFEDGIFLLNVFQFARKISYLQVQIYHYRLVQNSLCHKNDPQLVLSCKKIAQEVLCFAKKYGKDHTFYDAYYSRIIFFAKKIAIRSFFYKANKASFITTYKSYRKILLEEPYKTAIEKISDLRLVDNEKYFGRLLYYRLYFWFCVACSFKSRR